VPKKPNPYATPSNSYAKSNKISQSAVEILKSHPLSYSLKDPISTLHDNPGIPTVSPAKVGFKPFGAIISYAANTHNGIIRPYNEDRISIVLDLKKPPSKF